MSRRKNIVLFSFLMALAVSGCTGVQRSVSANQNSRVSIVVIHHTTSNFEDSHYVLTEPTSRPVSSHYLIPEPDDPTYGKSKLRVYQLVDEDRRAWHAGVSYWAGKNGINDQSIGIELVNQTYCHANQVSTDPETGYPERICFYPDFDDGQLALLVDLLDDILERHPDIRPTHIVGHSDVAPDRKIDPGPRFPWQRLAKLGYGAWFDNAAVIRYWERFLQEPLPLINVQKALAAYGYGIEPTGENDEQTRDVVRAFQLHFRPYLVTREADVETTAILFALIEKYYPEQLDELLVVEAPQDTGDEEEETPAGPDTAGIDSAP
jgi:N-acetylmuramoyl-L-alanine amidase